MLLLLILFLITFIAWWKQGSKFTYLAQKIIPKQRHCATFFGKCAYLLVFQEWDENIDTALMLSPELVSGCG